jgi:hypothetical protein
MDKLTVSSLVAAIPNTALAKKAAEEKMVESFIFICQSSKEGVRCSQQLMPHANYEL